MAREEAEIKDLSKKLAQNPDSLVFAPLADSHRKLGKLDEAIEICLKGLAIHPTYMTARVILGRTYFEKTMLDEAVSEFKTIASADPNNIMAHSMLGQIYMKKGMFAEAIDEQQRVLALNPDDASAQSLLNEALEKARETTQPAGGQAAGKPAASAAKEAPAKEKLATITVGDIYVKKGALDEAIEVFKEILASDPDNQLASQKLAEVTALKDSKKKMSEAPKVDEAAERKKREDEEARRQAEGMRIKQEEDARRKKDDEARQLAEESRRRQEEEGRRKQEEEARKEAEAKKAAAAKPAPAQGDEEGDEKITPDDILSVMKVNSPDEVIVEDHPAPAKPASAPAAARPQTAHPTASPAAAAPADHGQAKELLTSFNTNHGIEGSIFVDRNGQVVEAMMDSAGDTKPKGLLTASIFSSTEKAVSRMRQGKLHHIIVTGEDGRQIIFAQLKAGILVAIANKNMNFGLLRIALNELIRKAG